MTRDKDWRKAEKEEILFDCLSKDFFVTRGYLKAKSGISYSGIDTFAFDNENDLIIDKAKISPTRGRAEAIYKLK
ncbi:hypothetical protein EOM81_07450 [bacterium]|nr:hypothetical protein [bacterium]